MGGVDDARTERRSLEGGPRPDSNRIHRDQAPEIEFYISMPWLGLVSFGHWDDMLREPSPPADLIYSRALWHYARGMAFVAQGQPEQVEVERRQLGEIASAMPGERIIGLNSAAVLLRIASQVLSGQTAAKNGQLERAINDFEQAVRLQDGLRYSEPPDWYYPIRESLGRVLLTAGRVQEAERVFREDLVRIPDNPWSLYGLAESLRLQRKERGCGDGRGALPARLEDGRHRFRTCALRSIIGRRYFRGHNSEPSSSMTECSRDGIHSSLMT